MIGNLVYGAVPLGLGYGCLMESGDFNFRHLILMALKENLEAITIANGFKVDIKRVMFGKAESHLQNGEILLYSIRDTALLNFQNQALYGSCNFRRPSSRLRNIYVKLRLLVKGELSSEITGDVVELRENYADELIKALHGSHSTARQLYMLLLDGISNEQGLAAYDIAEIKEYSFSGDLKLESEILLQYKEKFC